MCLYMRATWFDVYFRPLSGMSLQNSYKERYTEIESKGKNLIREDFCIDVPDYNHSTGRNASCTMGTVSFPGVKSGRVLTLTPHPLLVPWSRKGRAIPLLPLWTVRPVQSLSACTRVHFTLYRPKYVACP